MRYIGLYLTKLLKVFFLCLPHYVLLVLLIVKLSPYLHQYTFPLAGFLAGPNTDIWYVTWFMGVFFYMSGMYVLLLFIVYVLLGIIVISRLKYKFRIHSDTIFTSLITILLAFIITFALTAGLYLLYSIHKNMQVRENEQQRMEKIPLTATVNNEFMTYETSSFLNATLPVYNYNIIIENNSDTVYEDVSYGFEIVTKQREPLLSTNSSVRYDDSISIQKGTNYIEGALLADNMFEEEEELLSETLYIWLVLSDKSGQTIKMFDLETKFNTLYKPD